VYNLLTEAIMEAVPVQLDQDLVELLEELQRPAKQAARELIVLELYRQSEVSSGRAAQRLGMEREEFIRYASEQGIPYFNSKEPTCSGSLTQSRSSECPSSQTPARSLLSFASGASISFRQFSSPF
jgi:predicted HTH domain antitoxin